MDIWKQTELTVEDFLHPEERVSPTSSHSEDNLKLDTLFTRVKSGWKVFGGYEENHIHNAPKQLTE